MICQYVPLTLSRKAQLSAYDLVVPKTNLLTSNTVILTNTAKRTLQLMYDYYLPVCATRRVAGRPASRRQATLGGHWSQPRRNDCLKRMFISFCVFFLVFFGKNMDNNVSHGRTEKLKRGGARLRGGEYG